MRSETCEWNLMEVDDEGQFCLVYEFETTCGKSPRFLEKDIQEMDYKYCPHCGGEIREVEGECEK